ncbi:Phage baseplate assembly protein W [Rubrivivax sp. A210]|uniref:GPW/gp25 family protein n=1 Tax=Rubrivivax sp. A210 TaxID=2772301 RepID=UPI00191B47B6|nr:GPW/gp25 family protein [Rubrivivax sp. A210]CAD5366030.1 Phage baseplate assembly protein W [Rubrivivax sp. A210]
MAREIRTAESLAPVLGRDLLLDYRSSSGFWEDADLDTVRRGGVRDIALADGLADFEQALANRLKTRKGELAPLGHPDYGSRHHELIGEPNVDRTRHLIKLYVLQALRDEPRIERVLAVDVAADHQPPRETVRITLSLRVQAVSQPLNLVLPFSLGV